MSEIDNIRERLVKVEILAPSPFSEILQSLRDDIRYLLAEIDTLTETGELSEVSKEEEEPAPIFKTPEQMLVEIAQNGMTLLHMIRNTLPPEQVHYSAPLVDRIDSLPEQPSPPGSADTSEPDPTFPGDAA